jgi:PAS domain S-box-containing protein/putative nucleotidyltransferase with HDIG domain
MGIDFKKILIIEDNKEDAQFIKELLSGNIGAEIEFFYASYVEEGIKYILDQQFDAILLDLGLPDSAGLSTLEKVIKKASQIPIIIVTGLEDEQIAKSALTEGAQDYLVKSQFDCNLLVHTINYAIDRKKFEKTTIANEEKYRSLFDNTVVGIYQSTIDGNYININSAFVKIFGYDSKDEMMKHSIPKQIYKHERDRLTPDKRNRPFVLELKRKDGSYFWAEVNSITVFEDRKPKYYQGVVRDITDRINAENNLKESNNRLAATLRQSIDILSSMVESRDPYTAIHQKNVARITVEIAQELGLSEIDINGLKIASVLHDMGKYSIPASILAKPAKLNDLEFSMIKIHPQTGYDIIRKIDFDYPVADIILQHHERLDGSGYPNGLNGKDICIGAKILAVADVVEAMSSHRPFRPSLGIGAALKELVDNKGKLYDPQIVSVCIKLFKNKEFSFKNNNSPNPHPPY